VANVCTKFEVPISTCYEDMKGDTKYRKWGGLGYLGTLKVTDNSTIWTESGNTNKGRKVGITFSSFSKF